VVSGFQGFEISRNQLYKVLGFQGSKESKFQALKVSRLWREVSRYQGD
jgi:hypothetical protein